MWPSNTIHMHANAAACGCSMLYLSIIHMNLQQLYIFDNLIVGPQFGNLDPTSGKPVDLHGYTLASAKVCMECTTIILHTHRQKSL
jgi:hypothetical protein